MVYQIIYEQSDHTRKIRRKKMCSFVMIISYVFNIFNQIKIQKYYQILLLYITVKNDVNFHKNLLIFQNQWLSSIYFMCLLNCTMYSVWRILLNLLLNENKFAVYGYYDLFLRLQFYQIHNFRRIKGVVLTSVKYSIGKHHFQIPRWELQRRSVQVRSTISTKI